MKNLIARLPADALRTSSLSRGGHVFLQGDRTHGMFGVTSGCIQLQRHTEAGVTAIIHTARAGELFAEASLFSDIYHCDAVALEASQIVRIDRDKINQMIAADPEFAVAVISQFARQIQQYRARMALLAIRSAKERVYAGMVEGMLGTDIKAFAESIGLTHEVVYRALAGLVRDQRITKAGRGKYGIGAE